MKLKNHSLRIGICSVWVYARILRAVLCERWLCGHCYLAQRRRGAEFFGDGFSSVHLGGTTSVSSGTDAGVADLTNSS